ncbi:ankyrin repeat and protein kinase domain-containing protein [Colletotrichum limetticola]|uniref:Ankyrin repeat and protein kinase domain-containing protein n=1 Tax=Colletotrichum limetticola TaxID=1209924 RepID=A0ABQ9PCC1_9PEZI|nr:ankyrin repeat and protein kinase domain-containing protein [Colletotrichum limetticola]
MSQKPWVLAKVMFGNNSQATASRPELYTFHKIVANTAGTSPSNESLKRRRKGAASALNRPSIETYIPYLDLETRDSLKDARNYGKAGKVVLDKGADIGTTGGQYGSALQAASLTGRREVVQLLLDKNANPNAGGGFYGSPLAAASFGGHAGIVQTLLKAGAEINVKRGSRIALQIACWEGYGDVAKILLEKGVDLNAHHESYGDPLQAASYRGSIEIVRMLLDRGADEHSAAGWFGKAIHAAMAGFHAEIRQILLTHAIRN